MIYMQIKTTQGPALRTYFTCILFILKILSMGVSACLLALMVGQVNAVACSGYYVSEDSFTVLVKTANLKI